MMMKSSSDSTSMENQRNPTVKVLTAGGAASSTTPASSSSSSRRHKRRNKKKKKSASAQQQPQQPKDDLQPPPKDAPEQQQQQDTPKHANTSLATPSTSSDTSQAQNKTPPSSAEPALAMEMEGSEHIEVEDDWEDVPVAAADTVEHHHTPYKDRPLSLKSSPLQQLYPAEQTNSNHYSKSHEVIWLLICFFGIMASFVCYGLLLEYTTSGGRQLHELSFLFVTSGLYTLTAATGRYVRDETPTTIPPARFAVLGMTSMGSTFCSVRSLRYVIYPIQVLAKSCKPVPVMIMGALMGKKYPLRKYVNVVLIVLGVALFMGGGDDAKKSSGDSTSANSGSQLFGILLLFISLCFDGGTGAYEDKLMSVHSVQPFDLMYKIQLGKTILAGIGLLVLNQLHIFMQMVQDMGFLLVALGLSGALGQVFIFVTIAKFGALTCSIIGLARKVTTLVFSIYFYGHHLSSLQFTGLLICITAMVLNFWGKKSRGGDAGQAECLPSGLPAEELEKMIHVDDDEQPHPYEDEPEGDVEMPHTKPLV